MMTASTLTGEVSSGTSNLICKMFPSTSSASVWNVHPAIEISTANPRPWTAPASNVIGKLAGMRSYSRRSSSILLYLTPH